MLHLKTSSKTASISRFLAAPAMAFLIFATAFAQTASAPKLDDIRALDGEWTFMEDRTEGRALEQLTPPMSSRFSFKVEEKAMILVWGHGGSRRDVRVALDGTMTEIPGTSEGQSARYRGTWKDGAFSYEIDFIREKGGKPQGLIRREFRMTKEGMIVRSNLGSENEYSSIGLYRHAEDIPMPPTAKALIGDISWLSGAWTGARGTNNAISFEERWSPAKGGAMLAISRTVSREKMSAFEFLRIVERDGSLIYIAQPNGATATEFFLTELTAKRAVFDNPRHDYPKRIVYELGADGGMMATIGYTKGGTPRKFEYKREGN